VGMVNAITMVHGYHGLAGSTTDCRRRPYKEIDLFRASSPISSGVHTCQVGDKWLSRRLLTPRLMDHAGSATRVITSSRGRSGAETRMGLWELPPLDVRSLLQAERAALLTLLGELDPTAWAKPTVCPDWSVKDVALHILDDDLGWLSRGR